MTSSVLTAHAASAALKEFAKPKKAKANARYFKCGKGEYGEGDLFLGVTVPEARSIAKRYVALSLNECLRLIKSPLHEERLLALMILSLRFKRADEKEQRRIYSLFMKNLRYVNNWDLVDSSAHLIAGAYLFDKDRTPLYELARSKNLWKKRVAIIATFDFIRKNDFGDTLKIAEILVDDTHDLIHKAVGWMLREVGNRDQAMEESFLRRHYKTMPRTMLRYAIEKFPIALRQRYMNGTVRSGQLKTLS